MKLLSIIVPVYNMEKYIDRCLESVLFSLTDDNIELLVINDGSTDNSQGIIEGYAKKYPEIIRAFTKANGGHGSVINFGIEKATGVFTRVLDSDDYVDSINLSKLLQELKEHQDVDLVLTSYYKDLGNKKVKQTFAIEENRKFSFQEMDTIFLGKKEKNSINYVPMSMSTYRTDILKRCGCRLLEKTSYTDVEFNIYFINEVKSFIYFDYPVYNYFIGRSGQTISSEGLVSHYEDHFRVLKNLIFYFNKYEFKTPIHKKVTEIMILRMINTQYTIYGFHTKGNYSEKEAEKNRVFDKWLKKESPSLYEKMGIRLYIKKGREKTFNPKMYTPNFFKRMIVLEILKGTWKKYDI